MLIQEKQAEAIYVCETITDEEMCKMFLAVQIQKLGFDESLKSAKFVFPDLPVVEITKMAISSMAEMKEAA